MHDKNYNSARQGEKAIVVLPFFALSFSVAVPWICLHKSTIDRSDIATDTLEKEKHS